METCKRLPGDFDLYRKDSTLAFSLIPLGFQANQQGFRLSVRPVAGYRLLSSQNTYVVHRWQGAETWGYMGERWGFYANLRDNYQSSPLSRDSFFTLEKGAMYKGENVMTDFAEMQAGLSYQWKWGGISLQKENPEWGNNYHGSNILSSRAPSFAHLSLTLYPVSWLEFRFLHGWLSSQVLDSQQTYNTGHSLRKIYRGKYLATNLLTITPWKHLAISLGNSVVYSDIGVQPLYFIPFLMYKAVDYSAYANSNDAGQNSQIFFDISSRNLKYLHLYTSIFIDELSFSRMRDPARQSNYVSGKLGARLSDFPLSNLSLTLEYTRTNPMTYQHFIETTSYSTNRFTLGHYLRDNSEELYLAADYRPLRGLLLQAAYTHARHGNNYVYGVDDAWGRPFMQAVTWEQKKIELLARYEIIERGMVFLKGTSQQTTGLVERFTPELYQGDTFTFEMGIQLGFR